MALSAWMLLTDIPAPPRRLWPLLGRTEAGFRRLGDAAMRVLPPDDRLALGILYGQHRPATLGTFFHCLLVTVAALGLMRTWDFDGRCLPMVLIAFGFLALAVSGLYWPLQLAHAAARPYMAALPLRRRWHVRSDATAVLGLAVPFAAVLSASLWRDAAVPAGLAAAAAGSFLSLAVVLRVPQLFSKRHAVVASTVVAAGWTFAAAHLIAT
ncbi:hypothetical protein [Xylophilus sp.]|uniref:hypothetical protein n=1 Tax=Xylophilus sp. TaxID=2653893 RepID=UPI002D802667|nr:hypothetical protein [Xylophilus sp.]